MRTPENLKIFVVDDDAFCLYMYERHLTNLGYRNIKTFDNGASCLESMDQKPDVIFLDHEMANLSGMDILKAIKRVMPGVHIVFISGQENVETVIKAMQTGAFEYIFKGEYDLENISKVMNKISESRESAKKKKPGLVQKLFMMF